MLWRAVISSSLLSASDSDEVQVSYDFEAFLWVDGMEELSIDTLVKAFDDAIKNSMVRKNIKLTTTWSR